MKKINILTGIVLLAMLVFASCEKDDGEDDITLPVVETVSISGVSQQSATANAKVTDDGGDATVSRGVCWGSAADPTIDGNFSASGTGAGTYNVDISGLAPSFTYHVRAYATNSKGTSYGADLEFTTPVK